MKKYIDADILRAYMKTILTGNDLYTPNGIGDFVESLPAYDVQKVRHGRWYDRGSLSCRCSECGCKANKETAYCPNCGAKMDEEE